MGRPAFYDSGNLRVNGHGFAVMQPGEGLLELSQQTLVLGAVFG
jgi:hypothetical protein